MLRLFRHYVPTIMLGVMIADLSVIVSAVFLSHRFGTQWLGNAPIWPKVLAVCLLTGLALYIVGLYGWDRRLSHREVAARLITAVCSTALLTAALGFGVPTLRFGRFAFLQIFAFLTGGLLLWRIAWNGVRSNQHLRQRVLILGVSRAASRIVELQLSGSQPFLVLGFLDDDPAAHDKLPVGGDLLGKTCDLLNLVDELQPDLVLVALPDMRGALPSGDLLECRLRGIRVEEWPTFYEKQTGKVLVTDLRPSWLIFSDGFVKTQVTQTVKRAADVILAAAGLMTALPLMLAVALAVKLDTPGPIFFRQRRVGQNGRLFTLTKFRSMRTDAERVSGPVWASKDDPRVTRVGRLLRTTRLDELPQLFNVLIGDMSFVGPRPERPEFVRQLQRQIPFYSGRLAVKPGITGWAQVRHQYAASVEDALEKLQYDLYYIKNLSPFLDTLILLRTIQVVLSARGAR